MARRGAWIVVDPALFTLDVFTHQVYNRFMICRVNLTRTTQKQLRKVPRHVAVKLKAWVGR